MVLKSILRMCPASIREKVAVHLGRPDLRFSLQQLKRFGFFPSYFLDVGAYRGEWSRICFQNWPQIAGSCVEPQTEPLIEVRALAKEFSPRLTVIEGIVGGRDQENVPFLDSGTGSSVLVSDPQATPRKMWRIDSLIDQGMPPPDILKLDVQGYELEALKGFEKHIRSCAVIQIELSLSPIVPGAPLLNEVVDYLWQRGFAIFDIDELIRAPSDGAVWQIDAIFCQKDSALRLERKWKSAL